jgi:hypothetical protein
VTKIVRGAGRSRYAAAQAKHSQRTPFGGGRDVHAEHTQALVEAALVKPNFAALAAESPWDIREWREAWDILGKPEAWNSLYEMSLANGQRPTEVAASLREFLR